MGAFPIEHIRDDLYIQKGMLGWKIVHPLKKDINQGYTLSNINWFNLLIGSWASFISLVIVLMLITGCILAYQHDTAECFKVVSNPCNYCAGYVQQHQIGGIVPLINFSEMKIVE